jgi:uncharacterized OB-fold protein
VTTTHGASGPSALQHCPDCGTEATPGGRFCRACGAPLQATEAGHGRSSRRGARVATAPERGETTGELPRVERGRSTAPGSMPRRACQNCGAPNSSQRELCGRCGADLDTGELTPRAEPRAHPGPPAAEGPGPRRWIAPLVAVFGVILLVLVGLALAGLGPFTRGPAIAEARFDEARYDDDPVELRLASIASLSSLPDQGGQSFAPTQMVDGDPSTAWNSDGGGTGPEQGIGERIDVVLAEPAWIHRLVIANGDQRDPDTYAANARIKRAQLTLDGGITFVVNLLDEGIGDQAVDLREPVLSSSVRLEVLEVFEGDTHRDLAVSDLAFEGWRADAEDVAVAEQRSSARPALGTIP